MKVTTILTNGLALLDSKHRILKSRKLPISRLQESASAPASSLDLFSSSMHQRSWMGYELAE